MFKNIAKRIASVARQLRCEHAYLRFIRMTGGDENNFAFSVGGRYIHRCLDCGATVWRNEEVVG